MKNKILRPPKFFPRKKLGGLRMTKGTIFYLLSVLFCASLAALPNTVQAALVPCGPGTAKAMCDWCDLGQLVKNVIDFTLTYIAIPLATAFVAVGGFMIMVAGGSPERAKKGRDILKAAIIGLIIALGAWLIIDTVIKLLTGNQFGPWNKISC